MAATSSEGTREGSALTYDKMRQELQQLASERLKIKVQLKELDFKLRADAPLHRQEALGDQGAHTEGSSRKRPRPEDSEKAQEVHGGADAALDSGAIPDPKRLKVTDETESVDTPTPAVVDAHAAASSPPAALSASAADSAAPAAASTKHGVQKNRRMFQNLLGTLQGAKRQIETGKVATAIANRHAVDVEVAARTEENSIRDAEAFKQKLTTERTLLQDRQQEIHAQMKLQEGAMYESLIRDYTSQTEAWLVTPAFIGVPLAWQPSKRDSLVSEWAKQDAADRFAIKLAESSVTPADAVASSPDASDAEDVDPPEAAL